MALRTRARRAADLAVRIKEIEAFGSCVVLDCGRKTAAREGSGLHKAFCRRHADHNRRHGSYFKPSYKAAEIGPPRRAALACLQSHKDSPEVREGVERIRTLYARAGRGEEAFRLAGKAPAARANYVWARLRDLEVDPKEVLSIWMAIALLHRDDAQPERKLQFRWVQAAKVLHRLAGGSHKKWDAADGTVELHKYPASRGRVLHHIGEALAAAAVPVAPYLELAKPRSNGSGTAGV